MAKPTDGFVIESTPPVDLGEWWVRRACGVVKAWAGYPRTLTTSSQMRDHAKQIKSIIADDTLLIEIDVHYDEDEWSVSGNGDFARITFWSPGACG